MSSKKTERKKKRKPNQKNDNLIYSEYKITFDPIENKNFKKLPSKIQDQIEVLHNMVYSNPKKAIPRLSRLIKKYPDVPLLHNYLSVAYLKIGDFESYEAVVLDSYKKHPDYLFARVNYAQICLQRGETEKIPIIFNNKFDLKRLYPHRSEFHVSEFVGFAAVVGVYFVEIGEIEAAKLYYKMLKKTAPRDPATKRLKRKLYPPLLVRLYKKLEAKAEASRNKNN